MRSTLAFSLVLLFGSSFALADSFRSTEEFHAMLTGCAVGSQIQVDADLIGNITDIYNGDRVRGSAVINSRSDFMDRIPERDKAAAYELYTRCIQGMLESSAEQRAAQAEFDERKRRCQASLDCDRAAHRHVKTCVKVVEEKYESGQLSDWQRTVFGRDCFVSLNKSLDNCFDGHDIKERRAYCRQLTSSE